MHATTVKISQKFDQYIQNLRQLTLLDNEKLKNIEDADPNKIIGTKNELINDGLIYVKYVMPIFKETLSV